MSDRLSLTTGAFLAVTGLAIIARLDFPVIQHGGIFAALAVIDLVVATVVVSALLGLATGGR